MKLRTHAPVVSSQTKWYVERTMKEQLTTEAKEPPSFHAVVEAADRLT